MVVLLKNNVQITVAEKEHVTKQLENVNAIQDGKVQAVKPKHLNNAQIVVAVMVHATQIPENAHVIQDSLGMIVLPKMLALEDLDLGLAAAKINREIHYVNNGRLNTAMMLHTKVI
mmetsp:Transcript_102494/g.153606  ORF Transcript_102494/g.153606 Transcript_102494/m.153606 type:complete len:116 (-) Transcript_102494:254-601(-)